MKLIIAGGRDYQLQDNDYKKLNELASVFLITEVVSGGCSGVDKCGEAWAALKDIKVTRFPANWQVHGKAAGPIRNKQMAEYADMLITFKGGVGTQNMIRQVKENNLVVI